MPQAWFGGDLNNGYTLECQGCKHLDDYIEPEPWICKGCGEKMYYPSRASW